MTPPWIDIPPLDILYQSAQLDVDSTHQSLAPIIGVGTMIIKSICNTSIEYFCLLQK